MTITIDFYYDVVSPFAFVALEMLRRYEGVWQADIRLRPIYLGGIMSLSGNRPPISVPKKGLWINRDRELTCQQWEIPMSMPKKFPFNTIYPMRFLRQLAEEYPDQLPTATDKLFLAVFGPKKVPLTNEAEVFDVLSGSIGLDDKTLKAVMQRSEDEANKTRLKEDTARVVNEEGAFGAPWMVVTREDGEKRPFWGADRFELMAWWSDRPWMGPRPLSAKL